MPVSVAIPAPPPAPPGYTLCAYEVRALQPAGPDIPTVDPTAPASIHSGSPAGFASATAAMQPPAGLTMRLAAVAWWIDEPMHKCVDGRERMVSVYDAGTGRWREWFAEQKTGPGSSMYGGSKWTRGEVRRGPGRRRIGSILDDNG